jgi:predicted CXXCH cytochrome family protein
MKKVIILAIALLLIAAGTAFSAVTGSKHDLSVDGGASVTSDQTEICVFCHTPHGGLSVVPLWNRSGLGGSWSADVAYSSDTMNVTSLKPSEMTNQISGACLTCHDGDVGNETLINTPGSGTGGTINWSSSTFTGLANLDDGSNSLGNDHPVGFTYADAITNGDSELQASPSVVLLFGGKVECATCHDVHNTASGATAPFLIESNANSQICIRCHIK